jgi:hypothetical protein
MRHFTKILKQKHRKRYFLVVQTDQTAISWFPARPKQLNESFIAVATSISVQKREIKELRQNAKLSKLIAEVRSSCEGPLMKSGSLQEANGAKLDRLDADIYLAYRIQSHQF